LILRLLAQGLTHAHPDGALHLALDDALRGGRPPLSPFTPLLVALIVMALEPESVLGPSFQMSFAAVAALIASSRATRRSVPANGRSARPVSVKVSDVASAATAPSVTPRM
jgi:predicted membrane metal-binding protein